MNAPVTVISCLYGARGFDRFVSEWQHSLRQLHHRPDRVIVVADRNYAIPDAHVFVIPARSWIHPQACYLDHAVRLAQTDWVWILDIDDQALPDALDGVEDVAADVWQMGYVNSHGETHLPPQLTALEVGVATSNLFTGSSAFRVDAYMRAGGFPDIAFQDWGLWRRMAASGATFESSGRPHYRYLRHAATRTENDLAAWPRDHHLAEMAAAESESQTFAKWYVETHADAH